MVRVQAWSWETTGPERLAALSPGPASALTRHIRLGPGPLWAAPALPTPAMVPWPHGADGAGTQAAPSAALGPAPLAAQEAETQDWPDISACPWPWLWPQAGLGECARMFDPRLAVALGAGTWVASLASAGFRFSQPCWVTGPYPELLPREVRRYFSAPGQYW